MRQETEAAGKMFVVGEHLRLAELAIYFRDFRLLAHLRASPRAPVRVGSARDSGGSSFDFTAADVAVYLRTSVQRDNLV